MIKSNDLHIEKIMEGIILIEPNKINNSTGKIIILIVIGCD